MEITFLNTENTPSRTLGGEAKLMIVKAGNAVHLSPGAVRLMNLGTEGFGLEFGQNEADGSLYVCRSVAPAAFRLRARSGLGMQKSGASVGNVNLHRKLSEVLGGAGSYRISETGVDCQGRMLYFVMPARLEKS